MPYSVLVAVIAALAIGSSPRVSAQTAGPPADRWTYSVTPYLWLPTLKGSLKYSLPPANGDPTVTVSDTKLLEALDFAAMVSGEARRGRLSFFGDFIYLKLSTSDSNVRQVDFAGGAAPVSSVALNTATQTEVKGSVLTLAAGYTMLESGRSNLDVIGGLRYFDVETTTAWQLTTTVAGPGAGQAFPRSGTVSANDGLWDGIVGARGRLKLADRWFVPYYVDVGAGSSRLTWQAFAGVSYAFGWGDVTLGYRHLFYDQGGDKLVHDFKFDGPFLGATFRF